MSEADDEFQRITRKTSLRCEVHLLIESHKNFLPIEGYCSRKPRWFWSSYALCEQHKQALQQVLDKKREEVK